MSVLFLVGHGGGAVFVDQGAGFEALEREGLVQRVRLVRWRSCARRSSPAAGVPLKPPVPQPQLTNMFSTGVVPTIGEASRVVSTMPAPGPEHVGPGEDREEFDGGGHLVLDHVEGAALAVAVVGVDAGAHDQFALVGLGDVDVDVRWT